MRRIRCSKIWSSQQVYAVRVLLLNMVQSFISASPKWSGGKDLDSWTHICGFMYQLPKGRSAGLALQYFYMNHRVGKSIGLPRSLLEVLLLEVYWRYFYWKYPKYYFYFGWHHDDVIIVMIIVRNHISIRRCVCVCVCVCVSVCVIVLGGSYTRTIAHTHTRKYTRV